MNKIRIFTIISCDPKNRNEYTASSVRLHTTTECFLDINSANRPPVGRYRLVELNLEIEIFSIDENRCHFWTLRICEMVNRC